MKKTSVMIPEGMTAKDVHLALHAGMQRRETLLKQEQKRMEIVRSGKYAMRTPLGYESTNGVLSINRDEAKHIVAIFGTLCKSRVNPSKYGKFSFTDVHREFLRATGKNTEKADSAFIRALVGRRAYIGEIWYRKERQSECAQIIPELLFDMLHESIQIVQPQHVFAEGWKKEKQIILHEEYADVMKNADIIMHSQTDEDALKPLFDIREVARELFTFKDFRGRKRRTFICLQKYDK